VRSPWTPERIKEGFEQFRIEHGRLPTAPEIDELSYLPSSRLIQLKFGGLEKLRTLLGYEHSHFGKGDFRSIIANRVGKRGRKVELALQSILVDRFGEVFVHTEKIFDPSKNRVDFYVYAPEGNFGIDVFYPSTFRSMQVNIVIKAPKYQHFREPLYFVVANKNLGQSELNAYAKSKIRPLAENISLVTIDTLFLRLEGKKAYPNPLKKYQG